MSDLSLCRKITGLSAEKWTLHQLKALQPRMQQAILTKNGDLSTVVDDLIGLFSFGSVDTTHANRKVLKSLSAELLSDVIKTLTVHHCSPSGDAINLSYQLGEEIFSCFADTNVVSASTTESAHIDVDENAASARQSSSLGTLASLGSIGFEENATLLLDHLGDVLSSTSRERKYNNLIKFAVQYLQFLQAVMNFHSNRKKLFTNICEVLLPSVMRLLNHCNSAHSDESLAALQTVLSEVIEKGLFDEKNVEELATLHLSSGPATSSTNNNNKGHQNKKQKGNPELNEAMDVENAEGARKNKVDSVKNKSFHDTLFRTLESRYYTVDAADADTSTQDSAHIVLHATSYASGVACLFKIYCAKSASIALQGSTQQPSVTFQARAGYNSHARDETLGMDAVNTRKHLVRVFHFMFQLIEAFHANKEGSLGDLLKVLEERSRGRKPAAETTATPGKKRKQGKQADVANAWTVEMVNLLKARLLRNAVLAACVEIVNQQAIPNHDSLYRYVELLVTLSTESVKDSVSLQAQLQSSSEAVNLDTEFSHVVLTADLECVRLIALIDHTTVVDHRLQRVVQVLGAPDFTGSRGLVEGDTRAAWVESHFAAKKDLFGVVLRVHGDLRLLDQLVSQLVVLDKQQVSGAQTSMLHAVISSAQVSRSLVSLFAAAPIGQLPQHWANLSGAASCSSSSEPQPTDAQVGVVTCSLARALMEAQLHSVRSNISVFSSENANADQVDANTVNMTVLLWRLTCSVQSLVAAQNTGKTAAKETFPTNASLVQNVLSTLSVLLRFVAHFHAGTIKQLVVPCLATAGSDVQVSFHSIAMGLLLNNLVALHLDDITFVPVVKALLSLVLLNSNITAKARTAAVQFAPQSTILSKYTLDILAGSRPGSSCELSESAQLDLMHLVLCDIRIWSQYVQNDASSSSVVLKPKQLVPLFQTYIRTGASGARGLRLTRVAAMLTSAAVADNLFIREAAHSALQSEWLALESANGKKTAKADATAPRTALLASLRGLFGTEFLYSATFFMPSVLAHLVACRALSSRDGAAAASSVLLGHLRSAPSERYTTQLSGYPAKSNVLDAALYILAGKVVSAEEVNSKVLDIALTQVYDLARTVLQDEVHSGEDSSLTLVNLLVDALLSRLVQQFNTEEADTASAVMNKAIAFVKEISVGRHCHSKAQQTLLHTALSCFVSAPVRKIENSATKDVNPSDPLIVSTLHQLVTELSQRLVQKPSNNKAADIQANSADLYAIGEAVVVISAMVQKSAQAGLTESTQSAIVAGMFQHAALVLSTQTAQSSALSHASGWLYLFGALSEQILLRFGVVRLPQITEAPTADMYLPITINISQLEMLCGVLQRMLTQELAVTDSELSTAESTALTMPVVSMLTNLLNAVLGSRMCNCEPHQILSTLKTSLLLPLQRGSTAARSFAPVLCRDVLIYFTEHGRKLLPGGKLPQEKFQQFHESLIELTISTYQDIIAGHKGQTAEDVNQLAALLYHTNCVTATVSAVLQRQGRGGARRKNKENDTKSTLFRCDLWFDGLLSTITLVTSHMHMWQESASASGSAASALECNASTVLLAKSLFQNVERLVAVSTSSSLPNLNTAIGAIVLAITSTVTLLLRIENAVTAAATSAATSSSAQTVTQSLQLNLNSCYHLVCRVFSTVASSQVLEKHVHFIACAAVEGLSKSSVSRAFQEVAYPGIYALFEKCQSRQKTQMFAMLDAQSRTLMTDLHNEFMRSFKFVGK